MSELKTNPLSRNTNTTSSASAHEEALYSSSGDKTRVAIFRVAAMLASSVTKPEKRDIAKVIKDFKLAVVEVESHFDLPGDSEPGNKRAPQGPIK